MFRGEQSFTESQIKEIKKLYLAGEGYPKIAKKYKVGKTTVEGLILDLKAGKVPFEKITSEEAKIRNEKFTQGISPKDADPKGLKKWATDFDGKTRPNLTAIAKQFGYKDKSATVTALNNAKRKDVLDLPQPKSKEFLQREKIDSKNIKYLNNDDFKKLSGEFGPDTYDKYVTGSDKELADFLNEKGHKAYGNKIFTSENINSRRARLGMPNTNITTRGKVFDEDFILQEVERMSLNVDVKNTPMDKIRTAVYGARTLEKDYTDAEKRTLYIQRKKIKNNKGKKRFFSRIPVEKTSKGLFWQDLVENALRYQTFLKGRKGTGLKESHIKFLNPEEARSSSISGGKEVKLIDTNVIDAKTGKPKILTYDNFLKHADDNVKLYGMNSKDILSEYEKKRFIQTDPELRDALNKKTSSRYNPNSASSRAVFSPTHIHHTAGRGKNAFNIQLGIGIENMQENAFNSIFRKEYKINKDGSSTTLTDKKNALKKYIENVPKNLEIRPNLKPYGTRESFEEILNRIANSETTFDRAAEPRDKITFTDEQLKGIRAFSSKPGGRNLLKQAFTKGGFPAVIAVIGGAVLFPSMGEAATIEKPETVQYNKETGSFLNTTTEDKTDQNQLLQWGQENPLTAVAGTSVALSANEVPRSYKMRRGVGDTGPLPGGKGKIRSAIGIGGALKPLLTTLGTPAIGLGFESLYGKQRLEEGDSVSDILLDPLGPSASLAFMEPLSKASGVVRGAPKRGLMGMFKNYTDLSNVGTAKPGLTSKALRLGMSPRMIAGASRFLGLPGLALTGGLAAYDAYKNYQNEEGMIYNLFNDE